VAWGILEAFERMLVCTNEKCSAYGDDPPDFAPGDIRCFICGTSKDHWTRFPFEKLNPMLQKCLRDLGLHK